MEALATASSELSQAAFTASVRFASEIGAAHTEIRRLTPTRKDVLMAEVLRLVDEAIAGGNQSILRWQNYLNVRGLHSKGCLRAAFATVSEGARLFARLCELEEKNQFLPESTREKLQNMLDDLEDVQENIALLIDDDARHELQAVLTEVGFDAQILEREDGDPSHTEKA